MLPLTATKILGVIAGPRPDKIPPVAEDNDAPEDPVGKRIQETGLALSDSAGHCRTLYMLHSVYLAQTRGHCIMIFRAESHRFHQRNIEVSPK